MVDGRHHKIKIEKRPYLHNALTDVHKIWHGDANWPSEGYGQLKFRTFKNLRWRTAAILKNQNTTISRQQFDRSAQNLAGNAYWPSKPCQHLKFRTYKNPRWRTTAILKNRKTAISPQRLDRSARNISLLYNFTLGTVSAVKILNS